MSYAAEFIADSSGKYAGNQVRFATDKEANDYGLDLARRWMAVTEMRVVQSDDPVNAQWTLTGVVHLPEKKA